MAVHHLDIDAFFASVEQRDDPGLRGRPVAVGTGVVASCSYEARHFGVRTGMRLAEARRLCRPLVVLPGAYPRYEQAARHVLAICAERTPVVEVAALDDLYFDVADLVEATRIERLARELREQIRDETRLSVSLGSGANKMTARVATNQAKPGKHVLVPDGQERAYLAPWPARVLPGVGSVIEQRLARLNVDRVHQVADMPVDLLRRLFGPRRGRTLFDQAHGVDPRPIEPNKPQRSVGRRSSFDPPVADRDFISAMLGYLIDRACSWLRYRGLEARSMRLTIRYGDYESAEGRERLRPASADEIRLKEAARDRLDRLYQRRLPLRFLGVELAPLVPAAPSPSLFAEPDEEKNQRLLAAKDAIRQRFGFTSLLAGSALTLLDQMASDRENLTMRTPCLSR